MPDSDDFFEVPQNHPIVQAMLNQTDQVSMVNDEFYHSVVHLFVGMNAEQLATTGKLLRVTGAGNHLAAYYSGVAEGILFQRDGVCFVCDKDHDELLADTILPNVQTCSRGHEERTMVRSEVQIGKVQCPECGAIEDEL